MSNTGNGDGGGFWADLAKKYLPQEMLESESPIIPPDFVPKIPGAPSYIQKPNGKSPEASAPAAGPDMSVKDGDKPYEVQAENENVQDLSGNFKGQQEITDHYGYTFGGAPAVAAPNVVSLHDYNLAGGQKYIQQAADPTAIKAGVSQAANVDADEGRQVADVYKRMQEKGEDQLAAIRSSREEFNASVAQRQAQIDEQTKEYTRSLGDSQAFWKNPGNVIAAIGMALMPLAGAGGDSGVKMIRAAVEADWRDRKALADSSMGHLKSNLAGYRDIMGDKIAGDYLGLAESYKVASMELNRIAGSFKGEKAQAQAAILIGQLDQQAAEAMRQAEIHSYMKPQGMNGSIEAAYRRSPEAQFIGDKTKRPAGVPPVPGQAPVPGGGGGGSPQASKAPDWQSIASGALAGVATNALSGKTDKPSPGEFQTVEARGGAGAGSMLTEHDDQYMREITNRFLREATPAERAAGSPFKTDANGKVLRDKFGKPVLNMSPAGQKMANIIEDETVTKPNKILEDMKKEAPGFAQARNLQSILGDMKMLEAAMGGEDAAKRAIPAAYLLGNSAEGFQSTWEAVKNQLFKNDPNLRADEKKVLAYRKIFTNLSAANNEDMKRVMGAVSSSDAARAGATGSIAGDWIAAKSKAQELAKGSQGSLVEYLKPALQGSSTAHRIAAARMLVLIGARPYSVNVPGQGKQK